MRKDTFSCWHILYQRWKAMLNRCNNPNDAKYRFYGGRGVRVCKKWENSFKSFYNWAINNGYRKDLVLDKDINGSGKIYSPSNCKFVTQKENILAKKHRTSKNFYLYKNKMRSVPEISKMTGVPYCTIVTRLRRSNYTISIATAVKTSRYNYNKKQIK